MDFQSIVVYFLDETGLRLDYTRRYGRASGSRRVPGAVPLTCGRSLTLIGALGVRGLTAVQVLEGALNQRQGLRIKIIGTFSRTDLCHFRHCQVLYADRLSCFLRRLA